MISAEHEKIIEGKKISLPPKLMYSLWSDPNNHKPLRVCAAATDLGCFHLKSQRRKTQTLESLTRDSCRCNHHEKPKSNTKAAELAQILDELKTHFILLNQAVATTTAEKVESWEWTFQ